MYHVKEIYYTLQGEGSHSGRPAIFCRLSGCNLWTGLEKDRQNAICNFCDTDFIGTDGENGGKYYSADDLAIKCRSLWPYDTKRAFIVITGGEPMLQVDELLINSLHYHNFEIAIETNGTISVPDSIDWICVSPKANSELVQKSGNELKLVYPQEGVVPDQFENLNFQNFYLQPKDSETQTENTQKAIRYCLDNPKWSLSLQTHKYLGID